MDISIIIPAFEEGSKIEKDIILADNFLNENKYHGEIIIVDDGSSDDTLQLALNIKSKLSNELIVLRNKKNLGKGGAVRKGILNSKGNFVLYQDAGATVPMQNALAGIKLLKNNTCDIAIGSRKLHTSKILKQQEFDRAIISKGFRFLMRLLFKQITPFTDTQCGFKIYRGDIARNIYAGASINGFMFEIEILLRALKNKYIVTEFPVEWRCDRDSRISLLKSPWQVVSDIIKIKKMNL
jgi:dolichyl-phosphate beta-glucosyltransferase